MVKKVRNSNIELLRILAMLFIVGGHFADQTGIYHWVWSVNDYIVIALVSGGRIAVNVFLLIGVWYLVDTKYDISRVLQLYGHVYIYSSALTVLMLLLRADGLSLMSVARSFVPFFGRALWFVSVYNTLILFKPFLDEVLLWKKEKLWGGVVLLLIFVCGVSTIPRPDENASYVCDTLWFLVVYLVVGYVKKYPFGIKYWNGFNLLGGCNLFSFVLVKNNGSASSNLQQSQR